jgi:hypothetical protein
LGGIWEINFSLSSGASRCCSVACSVIGSADWWCLGRSGASSSSRSGTGECGLMAARLRRDSSQRACSACFRSSRILSETWAYSPRIPGTWWPRRCSARISGIPSSAIQVLWLCLSPWGVRPGLIGSQQVSGVSSGMAAIPLPRGIVNSVPLPWAIGHAAMGVPGQTVASAMTSRAGRPGAGSCRPSQAGRNTRRA